MLTLRRRFNKVEEGVKHPDGLIMSAPLRNTGACVLRWPGSPTLEVSRPVTPPPFPVATEIWDLNEHMNVVMRRYPVNAVSSYRAVTIRGGVKVEFRITGRPLNDAMLSRLVQKVYKRVTIEQHHPAPEA